MILSNKKRERVRKTCGRCHIGLVPHPPIEATRPLWLGGVARQGPDVLLRFVAGQPPLRSREKPWPSACRGSNGSTSVRTGAEHLAHAGGQHQPVAPSPSAADPDDDQSQTPQPSGRRLMLPPKIEATLHVSGIRRRSLQR